MHVADLVEFDVVGEARRKRRYNAIALGNRDHRIMAADPMRAVARPAPAVAV